MTMSEIRPPILITKRMQKKQIENSANYIASINPGWRVTVIVENDTETIKVERGPILGQ